MNNIGLGYGSEWHMLRMLGRHRAWFTQQVLGITGGRALTWQDFGFTQSIAKASNYGDAESKGMDFLPIEDPARVAWREWWPQSGGVQNWDAIGTLELEGVREWVLVEAKGNLEELESGTKAAAHGGLPLIQQRLRESQAAFGVTSGGDWTKLYYQYANRLAALHFLTQRGVPARLVFVYFTGDATSGRTCPASASQWHPALEAVKKHLGLTGHSALEERVHELFVPTCPLTKLGHGEVLQ